MKKNAQTATAVIVISAILLLTVTAETAILLSDIWTREKYTLAFLVLAAGIALVYPLIKTFEEKALKKGYDKASEEISLLAGSFWAAKRQAPNRAPRKLHRRGKST